MEPDVDHKSSPSDPIGLYEPFACTISSVADLTEAERFFRIVRNDGRPFGHQPGQFMQVSIFGVGEAPISVSSSVP